MLIKTFSFLFQMESSPVPVVIETLEPSLLLMVLLPLPAVIVTSLPSLKI